jgi:vancomycin resistance protein VanW
MAPALFCGDERRTLSSLALQKARPDVSLRKAVRAVTPNGLRVTVARARRAWGDSDLLGSRPRLAVRPETPSATDFDHPVTEVVQEIKPTGFLEGKLANIRLSAALLDGVVVAPGEIFSFWRLVGRPSAAAGFAIGRSIRGGVVGGEVGGGLCQVSGIAYEAGLRAGLAVVERHPHSRDLYAEEERFTPLGLDATVVWPNKDLRLLNAHAVPVQVRFAIRDLTIVASVHAPAQLDAALLEIRRADYESWREVRVIRRTILGEAETISDDRYAAPSFEGQAGADAS